MLLDVHAHIDTKDFDSDREIVITRCNILIINAGVDLNSNLITLNLSRKYKNIWPAIGFHPEFIEKAHEVDDCLKLIENAKVISEVGLDYYWVKDYKLRAKQKEVLEKFLTVAEKYGKPVILHNRGGLRDLLLMLPSFKIKFVIHAYEGSVKDAMKIIELGGLLSFPPVIVRDKYRLQVIREIPVEYILTETDSPFLGPEKGKRNEPCNVVFALRKIAEIKNIKENELEEIILKNFKKLF
jgi:TatD DNase family protein